MFFTPQIPEITKPAWEWLTTLCYPTALMSNRVQGKTTSLETENPTWCPSVIHSRLSGIPWGKTDSRKSGTSFLKFPCHFVGSHFAPRLGLRGGKGSVQAQTLRLLDSFSLQHERWIELNTCLVLCRGGCFMDVLWFVDLVLIVLLWLELTSRM